MREKEELYSLARKYAMDFLEKGRQGWDVPHTRAVFYYAKLIAENTGQDTLVIPTAAWLHDIGYYGRFEDGSFSSYSAVQDRKKMHMEVGAKLAEAFVSRTEVRKLISAEQGQLIVHLVLVHDNYPVITSLEEKILVEADALGTIDVRRVKPTFDRAGRIKFLEELRQSREPLFITEIGRRLLKKLVVEFENYSD